VGAQRGRDPAVQDQMQQQAAGAEQGERQKRDQQRLRTTHDVVLGAQADHVDVDAEVLVLGVRGDVAEVEEHRAD
jgi:hypothetical protein